MMPEPFVVQTIASFLARCSVENARCHAVDIGGNLGLHTAYMAALGATVDVVEPQSDLAAAIVRTAATNCWQDTVTVHNRGITANETQHGAVVPFGGGWRLDDRGSKKETTRMRQEMILISLQSLLRGRTVHMLKIDIDNSAIEEQLLLAVEQMIAAKETDLRALVIEASTSSARKGKAGQLAGAFSRLQKTHGFHAYRLAHHLHTMDHLEPYYSTCIGVRAYKYALAIKRLAPDEWVKLLKAERDGSRGRADTMSIAWSAEPIGLGPEAQWRSDSMDKTLPPLWRDATCGAGWRKAKGLRLR